MNINFKLIKEKYPNGYYKFWIWLCLHKNIDNLVKKEIEFMNSCCYCDLEKFFDDNGIIITIDMQKGYLFSYDIRRKMKNKKYYEYLTLKKWNCQEFNSRQEAKEQAILKAFEILEGQLNEK